MTANDAARIAVQLAAAVLIVCAAGGALVALVARLAHWSPAEAAAAFLAAGTLLVFAAEIFFPEVRP